MGDPDEICELLFKCTGFVAQYIVATVQNPVDGRIDLILMRPVLRRRIRLQNVGQIHRSITNTLENVVDSIRLWFANHHGVRISDSIPTQSGSSRNSLYSSRYQWTSDRRE